MEKINFRNNFTKIYNLKILADGTKYVKTEQNLFTNRNGTKMPQKEIYNSIVGKKIYFSDGIIVEIVKWLPGQKNMYNELFRRYPIYQNIKDIKKANNNINENIISLLESSDIIIYNEKDYMNKHIKQKIKSFDTRKVAFYDGRYAYDLTFSIARLFNGKYIAYSKKDLIFNKELLDKIKKETSRSKSPNTFLCEKNISQTKIVVK